MSKKKLRIITILLILLIIIAISLVIIIQLTKNKENEKSNNNNTIYVGNVASEEELNRARDELIGNQTEMTRIKNYINRFFTAIQNGSYQEAYNMLFESFKNNYFKTIEEFTQYAKNKYPKNIVLNYTNTDKQGSIYILTIDIIDGLENSNKIEQRVVIEEDELNDFHISFQVE